MKTKNKEKIKTLSLIEAVETLSSIADLKLDEEAAVAEKHAFMFDDEKINYRTIYWLQDTEKDRSLKVIKEIFRVILSHLKSSWEPHFQLVNSSERIESIKTIMLLVGEAAKKLDRYTDLFKETKEKSVTELKEYLDLKKFYQNKISHIVDEGTLGKWLLNLTKGFISKQDAKKTKESLSNYIFIDLDQVKNDTAYELLFIRKEDGSRFFNPRLIRNMKLVIDFGNTLQNIEDDRLMHMAVWLDKIAMSSSKAMMKSLGSRIDIFFKEVAKHRSKTLPQLVSSALMALYLASLSDNSRTHFKVKTCIDYMGDFENYLHAALTSTEYQKMAAYPPKDTNHLGSVLFETIHSIVRAFFIHFDGYNEIAPVIEEMMGEAKVLAKNGKEKDQPLSKTLETEHENYKKVIRTAMHGPMVRNIEMIENWESQFAPLRQKNWPTQLFSLYVGQKRILCLKLASPTVQEYIHKAHVLEEFVAFLRASKRDDTSKMHLMFNLQDRTSWKEIARCKALESLNENQGFDKLFSIVTIPFDTDFYHQLPPYDQDNQFKVFKEHFIEQLTDESTGFYFQKKMKSVFKAEYLNEVIDSVNRVFFHGKNTMTRKERLDCISIVYLMLYLKTIEVTEPDSFSFTCKDCLDLGMSQGGLLFLFYKMLQGEELTPSEMTELHNILYVQQLIGRERAMLPERFSRMIGTLSVIESAQAEYGKDNFKRIMDEVFGRLISKEILHSQLVGRHR